MQKMRRPRRGLSEGQRQAADEVPQVCGKLEKKISAPAIQFKGSGWYVTDYGKTTKSEKSESESTTESKSEKTDKKTKESSPKKTSDKPSSSKTSTGD